MYYHSEKIFENEFILEFDIKNYKNIKLYKSVDTYPYNNKSYGQQCICDHLVVDEKTKNIFDKFDIKIFGQGSGNENVMDINDKDYFVDNEHDYCKFGDEYSFYSYIPYTLEQINSFGTCRYYDTVYIQFKNKKELVKFKLMFP